MVRKWYFSRKIVTAITNVITCIAIKIQTKQISRSVLNSLWGQGWHVVTVVQTLIIAQQDQ